MLSLSLSLSLSIYIYIYVCVCVYIYVFVCASVYFFKLIAHPLVNTHITTSLTCYVQ